MLRPCVRRNFTNFLFSRVSEMFGCWSLEKPEFSNLRYFCKKVRKKVRILTKIVRQFWKKLLKVWIFKSKNPVFGSKSSEKIRKKFRKVWKSSETGFSKHSEISEIVLFRTFQKLQKNDIKLELRKSRKTHSNSKTDLKVRLKVQNAGPYKMSHGGWP